MSKKQNRFDFFTMGGSQRWEDVFFYQKWRIQRNYKTKEYRLLDNWDIRRESGTFDDCYKKFLKVIEIYQLSRQRGHMVVMLHGIGQSKNIFKPLWREIIKYGYMAAAVNYPSTYKRVDSHVRQLDFFLNHLEDVSEVSFVVYGSGALILRKLLYFDAKWKNRIKVRKIVEINPLSNGSLAWEKVKKTKLGQKIFGPILTDLTQSSAKKIPEYPKKIKVGIICSKSLFMKFCDILPGCIRKYLPLYDDMLHGKIKDISVTNSNCIFSVFSNSVVSKCVKFMKSEEF